MIYKDIGTVQSTIPFIACIATDLKLYIISTIIIEKYIHDPYITMQCNDLYVFIFLDDLL